MDREFLEEYLKTHTQEELFESLDVVCDAIFDDTYDESARSMYLSKLRRIVYTAIDVAEIEIMNVDLSLKGAEGYYTEHTDDYPLREERDKTGHFYNSSGENSSYDTKTCVTEYTYYGDFAIMHDYGYSYDEGEYGWVNGEFRDELPSWDRYDDYFLEYKGFHIDKQSHISEKEFLSYAQSLTYIVVGDTMYFLNIPQDFISGVWETHKK
jgi:hypothetical protein